MQETIPPLDPSRAGEMHMQAILPCVKEVDFKRASYSFFLGGGEVVFGELKHFVLEKEKRSKN